MACEWGLQNPCEMILGLGDFNGLVGGWVDGFKGVHDDMELAKEMLKEKGCSSFAIERSCLWQTHGLKRRSREKQHRVWVEMKLKLFLYWLVKATESI